MLIAGESMELIKDDIKITWTNDDMGHYEDTRPSEPIVSTLLNFNIYVRKNTEEDNWMLLKDGFQTTSVAACLDQVELKRLLCVLMDYVYPALHNRHSKKINRRIWKMKNLREGMTLNELKKVPSDSCVSSPLLRYYLTLLIATATAAILVRIFVFRLFS